MADVMPSNQTYYHGWPMEMFCKLCNATIHWMSDKPPPPRVCAACTAKEMEMEKQAEERELERAVWAAAFAINACDQEAVYGAGYAAYMDAVRTADRAVEGLRLTRTVDRPALGPKPKDP